MKHFHFKTAVSLFLLMYIFLPIHYGAAREMYDKTPPDHEGPFYPVTKQQDIDNNLVQVKGRPGIARGDILNLSGVVVNTRGEPQQNVVIEIWQTDPEGRYKHPGDSTPGERDPDFQYWGAVITAADGTFFFKTIVPGAYEPRPPHIHYKVLKDGRVLLTSQIYFSKTSEGSKRPSKTNRMHLQTAELEPAGAGEFQSFFRIVL